MFRPNSDVDFEMIKSSDSSVYTSVHPYLVLSCPFLIEKVDLDFGLIIGTIRVFVMIVSLHLSDPSINGIRDVVSVITPAVSLVASLYSDLVNPGIPLLTNFSIIVYHLSVSESPKDNVLSVLNKCLI